jgi:two-component system cell cycle response regulator
VAGKKLLVADDSLTIQKVIRLALSSEGYEIQAISDGGEAIQQISLFRPDLILIDVSLPTRTAFEIKRDINEMGEFEDTKFILMSSAFEKIDEAQAKEVVFHGRLTKPFDPAHLRQVLLDVLHGPATKVPTTQGPKTSSRNAIPVAPSAPPPGLPSSDEPQEMSGISIHLDPPSDFPSEEVDMNLAPEAPAEEFTPPPLPQSTERADENSSEKDDIRHLTESTIRMSGLDDFEWKVNDSGLNPPSSFADDGDTGFQMSPQFTPSNAPPSAPQKMPQHQQAQAQKPKQQKATATLVPAEAAPSQAQIEELVKRQVEQTLSELTQRILPEVCERVIKAEISRLLNEKI